MEMEHQSLKTKRTEILLFRLFVLSCSPLRSPLLQRKLLGCEDGWSFVDVWDELIDWVFVDVGDRHRAKPLLAPPSPVAESLERAMKRGAPVIVEYLRGPINCDAYHMTGPRSDGLGVSTCIQSSLEDAGVSLEEKRRDGQSKGKKGGKMNNMILPPDL